MISIKEERINSQDGIKLIEELSCTLEKITGNSGKGSFDYNDMLNTRSIFVIARDDNKAVGCGAFREITDDVAEIKRMYASEKNRGIGKMILLQLENREKEFGYLKVILETRKCNNNAIRFYLSNRYKIIDNYGKNKEMLQAVCFEKVLNEMQ
ncbi:putative acetyltransferase [Clostridium neonatale]|uniref:GNAT family N-acetyltransferase n=1 Tax=Clostridium neonatale TaxID=137838 RepID=UPI00291BC17B|nr:GNAT family N-acetyltransferase [Clostridium neonatale]CAI3662608.1 putative acetyltransferase [Clostridium neonatale]